MLGVISFFLIIAIESHDLRLRISFSILIQKVVRRRVGQANQAALGMV